MRHVPHRPDTKSEEFRHRRNMRCLLQGGGRLIRYVRLPGRDTAGPHRTSESPCYDPPSAVYCGGTDSRLRPRPRNGRSRPIAPRAKTRGEGRPQSPPIAALRPQIPRSATEAEILSHRAKVSAAYNHHYENSLVDVGSAHPLRLQPRLRIGS